jgi:transcriptional regulator
MQANPFVILISDADDGPFATHVPVAIRESDNKLVIRGHFAKANPHWRHLEKQPLCLTIFHGPHSYISPGLYTNRESVPTWNYGAVHAYGSARLLTEPEPLLGILHELMGIFEPAYANQWASLSAEYRERMLHHIVGFEITTTRLEAKFKLGQNRTREDQSNIIAALGKSEDTSVSGVARMMRDQGLGADGQKPRSE